VHDFAGPVLGHLLVRAEVGVFKLELVERPAGVGIEHLRIGKVDTEFRATAPNRGLLTQDGQIDDTAGEQPTGREQNAIVVALRQHDVSTVDAAGTRTSAG